MKQKFLEGFVKRAQALNINEETLVSLLKVSNADQVTDEMIQQALAQQGGQGAPQGGVEGQQAAPGQDVMQALQASGEPQNPQEMIEHAEGGEEGGEHLSEEEINEIAQAVVQALQAQGMNKESNYKFGKDYIAGFIKNAADKGLNFSQTIELYKAANFFNAAAEAGKAGLNVGKTMAAPVLGGLAGLGGAITNPFNPIEGAKAGFRLGSNALAPEVTQKLFGAK